MTMRERMMFPGRDLRREEMRFILANADRQVIYAMPPGRIGQPLSDAELKRAVPLEIDRQAIGWLLLEPGSRDWLPGSPEVLFLRNVAGASLASALAATALALALGGLLAYTLTRSLRELTEATVAIAQGRLGRQVAVRSQDELGELAASFNQMSQDLERATQSRRQMTADIAHELRSPLSVIAGYAEALSDGKLPGSPEIYAILHQETVRLSRLIDELRVLSLADAGELPLTRQTVEAGLLLERTAARHAVAAEQNRIALRVQAEAGLPALNVDVERMAQVLDNLVLNAFRYTPAGGEVTLAARRAGSAVELQVRDSGSGIASEDLAHIFERFYRGDKSRPPTGESGLGLAIARSIVAAHGGTLEAANVDPHGAAFTIRLASG
jgi:signal transduction histidine kinase